jgi:hypothetical protein
MCEKGEEWNGAAWNAQHHAIHADVDAARYECDNSLCILCASLRATVLPLS